MCLSAQRGSYDTCLVAIQGKHHRGHKHGEAKGKWRNKVKKISELLSVMDKMQAPGGLPFVNARDISACEDLLEAYFMQVSLHSRMQEYKKLSAAVMLLSAECCVYCSICYVAGCADPSIVFQHSMRGTAGSDNW